MHFIAKGDTNSARQIIKSVPSVRDGFVFQVHFFNSLKDINLALEFHSLFVDEGFKEDPSVIPYLIK